MIDNYRHGGLRPPVYNDVDAGALTLRKRSLGFGPNAAVVVAIHQTRYLIFCATVEDWRGYVPGRMNSTTLSNLHIYGEVVPNYQPQKDILLSKPKIRRWYHDINR